MSVEGTASCDAGEEHDIGILVAAFQYQQMCLHKRPMYQRADVSEFA